MRGLLSIFNSDIQKTRRNWGQILLVSLVIYLAALMMWEIYLDAENPILSVQDDYVRWAQARSSLSQNDACALVIVGESRSQMAIDLDEMEKFARSRPVQLSIIG